MDEETRLSILKKDLQMLTSSNDDYLKQLLKLSEQLIRREGIEITPDIDVQMSVIHYAAYLYRKRAGNDTGMPRFLRYELNNILFSQKAGGE